MSTVLYLHQLKQATVLISHPTADSPIDCGTGFLINGQRILTALHVLGDAQKVSVQFLNLGSDPYITTATLLSSNEEADVALLQLNGPFDSLPTPLPISKQTLRLNSRWEAYGFPAQYLQTGRPYRGRVLQFNQQAAWHATLEVENSSIEEELDGLSGAPVQIGDYIVGVVRVQNGRDVGIVTMDQLSDWLEQQDIPIEHEETPSLELDDDLPLNEVVHGALTRLLETRQQSWYLLSGSPGSGKTTLVAMWEPKTEERLDVCGRYYLKQPNDPTPGSIRASKESLLTWLEDIISINITGQKAPAPEPATKLEERIQRLQSGLSALSDFYQRRNKRGIIFIDGLDDSLTEIERKDFLSILPLELEAGVCMVFSATNREVIPVGLLREDNTVTMQPLAITDCISYISRQLPTLTSEQTNLLAQRTEGHPLYMRYLIGITRQQLKRKDLSDWLAQLPVIGGDISQYYVTLWQQLVREPHRFAIALTVTALRGAVPRSMLYDILTPEVQLHFESQYPQLTHLFKGDEQISLYHDSFRHFLIEKAFNRFPQIHDQIAGYCSQNIQEPYAIANIVYHLIHSLNPSKGVVQCNQEWADRCAQYHIEPDFVLSDVRSAKARSITEGKLVEVVRLQLLHHRVSFRYNQIFSYHVSQLADTLLALNQPEAALRYLIRDGVIQVSDEDLIAFVVRLFEMGAEQQGKVLLEALQVRGRHRFIDALNKEYLEVDDFRILFAGHTLTAFTDPEIAHEKFASAFRLIVEELFLENDDNTDSYKQFTDDVQVTVVGFNTAFALWYYEYNLTVSELKEKGVPFKVRDAGFWCTRIQYFKSLDQYTRTKTEDQALYSVAKDVLLLVKEAGYQERDLGLLLTYGLAYGDDSTSVTLLGEHYLKLMPEKPLRAENGVDLDRTNLAQLQLRACYIGYRSVLDTLYPSVSKPTPYSWEKQLSNLTAYIGHAQGQFYRLRSDGQMQQVTIQYSHLQQLEGVLAFSLEERAHWERSYALPEALLPYLYRLIAELHVTFFPEKTGAWLEGLLNRATTQFGLYSEGFRECLFRIIDVTFGRPNRRLGTFKLLNHLEKHVIDGVQNRWERTPALLRIAEYYALNGNQDRSQRVYADMLRTSMGPSWYKEDQFALVSTVIKHAATNYTPAIGQLLGHLDAASGEMTFQRYVQQEKSALPRTLADQHFLAQAIAYYKAETLPPTATAISNAESFSIDQLRVGEGYQPGARSLTEASTIANLLEALPTLHPAIAVAFCQIFTNNDDTWRYAHEFGRLHGQSLSQLLALPSVADTKIASEWYQWWRDSSFTEREIHEYWPRFHEHLSDKAHAALSELTLQDASLIGLLKRTAHKPEPESTSLPSHIEQEEFTGFPGTGRHSTYRRMQTVLQQVADEDAMENYHRASTLLKEYVDELTREGWDVWAAENYSRDMGRLMTGLVVHAQAGAQLVQALDTSINNSSYWSVANRLIKWGSSKLETVEREQLISVVGEHLQLLTQASEQNQQKYGWLADLPVASSIDVAMIDLLVWHLQHPDESWRDRAETELMRLTRYLPGLVITALLEVAIGPFVGSANQKAASLLPQLVQSQPAVYAELLATRPDLISLISEQRHVLIKHYLIETLSKISSISPMAQQLRDQLENTTPKMVILSNEVYLDEPYLRLIQDELAALNQMNLLNRDFCQDLLNRIQCLCAPLTVSEQYRADRYIKRSFSSIGNYCSPFQALLRFALNNALAIRVDRKHWIKVIDILTR